MYLDQDQDLSGHVVLVNPYIHKKANISKSQFLRRVENVKYLRTANNSHYISFYITSLEEYNHIIKFHELVNQGIFDFENCYVLALAIQPRLYKWFKTNSLDSIMKQIVSWLASSYYFKLDKREIMDRQIYPPLLEEMRAIIDRYYKGYPVPDFPNLFEKFMEDGDDRLVSLENQCKSKYQEITKAYSQSEPPEFLSSPFGYDDLPEWGVNSHYNFEFVEAYFNLLDWERIVVKGNSRDDLARAESRNDLWLKWKHVYTTFDKRDNFVYSFYLPNSSAKSTVKTKREGIPQSVRNQVWRRDQGMCVICSSKENLEFDHIIPVSKGGASTYRNVQLLCESSNRSKSNKI